MEPSSSGETPQDHARPVGDKVVHIAPNPFLELWRRGYRRLVPIIPPDAPLHPESGLAKRLAAGKDARGKAPGVRWPSGFWAGFDWVKHDCDESDLERWRAMGAGCGIKAGRGLAAIDADLTRPDWAAAFEALLERKIGRVPKRVGQAPKAVYLVRTDLDAPYMRVTVGPQTPSGGGDRIEILGDGKQFVAWGMHPKTRAAFRWERPLISFDELSFASKNDLVSLLEEARSILPSSSPVQTERGGTESETNQESLRVPGLNLSLLRDAAASLPNTADLFPTRESYRDVGYAIKASVPLEAWPDAFEIWWGWCSRWEGGVNAHDVVESDWRRMKPPFRRGWPWLASIVERTSAGGGRPWTRAAAWFEEPPAERPPDAETSVFGEHVFGDPAVSAAVKEALSPLTGGCFRIEPIALLAPREFLYGHHYIRTQMSVTVAPTKVGKSSLSIAEALAMCSGKPLLGVEPQGQLRVRIWNGEDPEDEIRRRVYATMQHYGLAEADIGDRLFIGSGRDRPMMLALQNKGGAVVCEAVVRACIESALSDRLDALILDPVIKTHGVNENDNVAIDLVGRSMNQIAGAARLALDGVHHVRKSNGAEASIEDARGASSLVSASRAARVLARMTADEGRRFGVERWRSRFRFADAASNLAPPPSGALTEWMELRSVRLQNGRENDAGVWLPGDDVGVVCRVREEALSQSREARVDALFLALLPEYDARGSLSHKTRANNYAPRMLAQNPEANGVTVAEFAESMERLLHLGALKVDTYKTNKREIKERLMVVNLGLFD